MAFKIIGGLLAGLGGFIAAFMAVLAIILIGFYVEWDNAADALRTVFFLTVPAGLLGIGLAWAGRAVFRRG